MSNPRFDNLMLEPAFVAGMTPKLHALASAMARTRRLKLLRAKAKAWGLDLSAPELDGREIGLSCGGVSFRPTIPLSVDTIESMIDEAIAHAKRVLAS